MTRPADGHHMSGDFYDDLADNDFYNTEYWGGEPSIPGTALILVGLAGLVMISVAIGIARRAHLPGI